VFVNPISGRKMARQYYNDVLLPMLEFNQINHEMFETDSSSFIDEFFSNFKVEENSFTEFVIIGGDGVFGQVINSIMSHPDKEQLVDYPIGIMPGGSSNSLC